MFSLVIAGTRSFNDYSLLSAVLDQYIPTLGVKDITILSGHGHPSKDAKGADYLGEQYAKEHDYPVSIFPANWDKFGRAAGPIRNSVMAKQADGLVIFWNQRSRGSPSIMNEARKRSLPILTVFYLKRQISYISPDGSLQDYPMPVWF